MQLATIPNAGYTSLFERFSSFDEALTLANMMAQSCFVPSSFRREGAQVAQANCLIAMDLANSLGIKPTSIFPHLYVIDGRPSLSAQFIIALVNRTGRFSIIEWEEGEDGVVTYEGYGGAKKNVSNYYAVAKFTELSSGKEYRSTRVDVELARRSGWLTKNGSKWQTNPREMARWRSASWLVKNYCPETILGFDAAEDVRDYQAEETTSEARVNARSSSVISSIIDVSSSAPKIQSEPTKDDAAQDDAESELNAAINAAKTAEELQNVASEIAKRRLDAYQRDRLRSAYKARINAIRSGNDQTVDDAPETPVEPAETQPAPKQETQPTPQKKTTVKKAPAKKSEGLKIKSFDFAPPEYQQELNGLKKCSPDGAAECMETLIKRSILPIDLEVYSMVAMELSNSGDFNGELYDFVCRMIADRLCQLEPTAADRINYIKTRLSNYAGMGKLDEGMRRINAFTISLDKKESGELRDLYNTLEARGNDAESQSNDAPVDPIVDAIKNARSADDLTTIQNALQAQFDAGELREGAFGRYVEIIEQKALLLEDSTEQEPERISTRQRRNGDQLLANVESAKTRSEIENILRSIKKFGSDGSISPSQLEELTDLATKKQSSLMF